MSSGWVALVDVDDNCDNQLTTYRFVFITRIGVWL